MFRCFVGAPLKHSFYQRTRTSSFTLVFYFLLYVLTRSRDTYLLFWHFWEFYVDVAAPTIGGRGGRFVFCVELQRELFLCVRGGEVSGYFLT